MRSISPFFYEKTEVINLRMQWSNGFHQSHDAKLKNENLNYLFLSHYIFIGKYISAKKNNVYGLTGTLGGDTTQKLFKKIFDVNAFIVTNFRKSISIILHPKTEVTEEKWKNQS